MRPETSLFKSLPGASEIFMHLHPTFHTMFAAASAFELSRVEREWIHAPHCPLFGTTMRSIEASIDALNRPSRNTAPARFAIEILIGKKIDAGE
jgi:hypothetical protein